MKLYATVTSERATKGQGGNKFIEYRLNVGEQGNSTRALYVRVDAKDEGYHLVVETDGEKIDKWIPTKGKKQKGECNYVSDDSNFCITHDREH